MDKRMEINPAAGLLFPDREKANQHLRDFLKAYPEFKPESYGYKATLNNSKKMRNKLFAFTSIQKREKGQWAWVLRFTVRTEKLIRIKLSLDESEPIPAIPMCYNILLAEYFPLLVTVSSEA